MKTFKAMRTTRTAHQTLTGSPGDIFPLLCPIREYDWIEHWSCEMIYSTSGFAEPDCIFTTSFPEPGGRDTWVVCRHEPPTRIEFIRTNILRVMRYAITLEEQAPGRTRARWQQIITATGEEGNEHIRTLTAEAFAAQVATLETLLNHYLQTGRMLRGQQG